MTNFLHEDYKSLKSIFILKLPQQVPAHVQTPQQTTPHGPAAQDPPGRQPLGNQAVQDLNECQICGRRFATHCIATHQNICAITLNKKRNTFGAAKQQVKETEEEAFLRKVQSQPVNVRDISMHMTLLTEVLVYRVCLHYSLSVLPLC
jgi:hypothetical protein